MGASRIRQGLQRTDMLNIIITFLVTIFFWKRCYNLIINYLGTLFYIHYVLINDGAQ